MDRTCFASDNCTPVHDRVISALLRVNIGYSEPYGGDMHTAEAVRYVKGEFGCDPDVYFVYNGTAANVISIKGCVRPFEAVIASDISHIDTDECGAPEAAAGAKILTVKNREGKIGIDDIRQYEEYAGSLHQVQPKLVSLTQATEYGTVYSCGEIAGIAEYAHARGMFLHIDGARIANACISEGVRLKEMVSDTGADILSLGISKNGGMFGDAVVVFNETIKKDFRYIIKNSLNLHSKNRYIAAQFTEFFRDGLFYENARIANLRTQELYSLLRDSGAEFLVEPQANSLFIYLENETYEKLSDKYFFYRIHGGAARIMTSYATGIDMIRGFADDLKKLI